MAATDTKERQKQEIEISKPSKYKVIVLNDNSTPMDFVVAMLVTIFKHSPGVAEQLTMKIHHEGSAVAGVYSHEIAEQKIVEATTLARDHKFPLVLKAEPE